MYEREQCAGNADQGIGEKIVIFVKTHLWIWLCGKDFNDFFDK